MTPLVFIAFSVIFLLLLCARTGEGKKFVQSQVPEVIGDHRFYRQTGITDSLRSIDFSLVSCWGDRTHQTVTIEYLLAIKGTEHDVAIHGSHVRAIDNRGGECVVRDLSLNLDASSCAPETQPFDGIYFKGKVTLQIVHSDTTALTYTALVFMTGRSQGGADQHEIIEIRALPIDWVA